MKKIITVILLSAMLNAWLFYLIDNKISTNCQQIEQEIKRVEQIVEVDTARELGRAKINKLIDFYNPQMKPMDRYEIVVAVLEVDLIYSNLDIDFICAVITQESLWKIRARSSANALGLMQLKQSTANWVARKKVNLYNPGVNIRVGCKYLSDLLKKHGTKKALIAYNSGNKGLSYYKRTGKVYRETRKYVPNILAFYKEYQNETGRHRVLYTE